MCAHGLFGCSSQCGIIQHRATCEELDISWLFSRDRQSVVPTEIRCGCFFIIQRGCVRRAGGPYTWVPVGTPKRERAGRASRPRASGVDARKRHSKGFGTYGPVRGERSGYGNKLRRNSLGAWRKRSASQTGPEQYQCLNTRCATSTSWLSVSKVAIMVPWLSRAKLPGRSHLVRDFLRCSHPDKGLVKQSAPGRHGSCRRLPLTAVLQRHHVLAGCLKKTIRKV